MATQSVIKIKRSSTQGSAPGVYDASTNPNGLVEGEIAVNLFDRKIYVGNSAGVTAIGGEDFRLTTQTAGEGAYIKLNGDSVLSTNTVLVRGGAGIDVATDANGSISVTSTAGATISAIEDDIADLQDVDTALWTQLLATNTAIRSLVSTNAADIATNAADIATNATDIATNAADIATNASDIATLQTDVATNASDIATNAADIARNATNIDQKLGATATVTLTGDVTGTASFSANSVSIATTYNNDVVLGTDTSGNYVAAISGTANEVEVSGSGSEGASVQVGLPDDVVIGNDLTVTNDLGVQGNVTIDGNLTVEGGVTYISSSTVNVDDTMLKLSANNSGDSVDHGVYAKYVESATTKYAGYFRDASDNDTFKFYIGLQTEPTTTVDTGATGYQLATIEAVIDGGTY
jgi:hypothetical protein